MCKKYIYLCKKILESGKYFHTFKQGYRQHETNICAKFINVLTVISTRVMLSLTKSDCKFKSKKLTKTANAGFIKINL